MTLRSVATRLRDIRRFGGTALSFRDLSAACVLGLARRSPFDNSNLVTSLGHRYFPLVSLRPKALNGGRVWLDTSDLGQLISYEEIIVDGCYDLTLVPFTPTRVLDFGAHVGLFSAIAASRYPHAHLKAVEPNPRNCRMLRQQFAHLNSRVDIVEAAVSIEEGQASFEAEFSNAGRLVSSSGGFRVNVLDIRKILAEEQDKALLMKIDVEGEERKIMPVIASSLPTPCAVFFETHHDTSGWLDVSGVLKNAGFDVQLLRQRDRFCDGFALRS